MTDDEPVNEGDPSRAAEQVADEAAKAMTEGVATVADASTEAVRAVNDMAQDVATHAADAYAETTAATAKAFEDARERLNKAGAPSLDAVARPLADGKFGQALFEGMGQDYARASRGLMELNARAIEAWRANTEATVAHWQSLAGVKTLSEMIALNSAHARRQIEAMTEQARDLAAIAGRMTAEGSERLAPKIARE